MRRWTSGSAGCCSVVAAPHGVLDVHGALSDAPELRNVGIKPDGTVPYGRPVAPPKDPADPTVQGRPPSSAMRGMSSLPLSAVVSRAMRMHSRVISSVFAAFVACQHSPVAPPPAPPVATTPPPAFDASVAGSPIDVPPAPDDASAIVADVTLRAVAAARPCEVRVELADDAGSAAECVELERVRPEGRALSVCFGPSAPLRFRYDGAGRIVEAPGATYAHQRNGSATRTRGTVRTTLAFDPAGRVVREDRSRITYTPDGRVARREGGGRFVEYVYQPDGTYTTRHNYPDRDEFCVADLVEVRLDAQGRPALERYDNCGINEVPRTLRTSYGSGDRIERIEVDLRSDGTTEGTVRLRYPDADGGCGP